MIQDGRPVVRLFGWPVDPLGGWRAFLAPLLSYYWKSNFPAIAGGGGTPHSRDTEEVVELSKPRVDRRSSDRFPIEREVRYRILSRRSSEESGQGKTINMSSRGVLFTTDEFLIPGKRLELSVSWPAQLNDKCALKLVARGKIVRTEQGRAAVEIQQYEFRTQRSGTLTAPELVPARRQHWPNAS